MRDYRKLHTPRPLKNLNIKCEKDLINFLNQRYFLYSQHTIYFEILNFEDDNNKDIYGIRFRKRDDQLYGEDLINEIEEDGILKVIYDYPDSWSQTYVIKVPVELDD